MQREGPPATGTDRERSNARLAYLKREHTGQATLLPAHAANFVSEYDVTARLAELDLVVADLTRANERVATVERRNVRQSSV